MTRYLRLLAIELRVSLVLGMQYRTDFLIDGAITMAWTAMGSSRLCRIPGRPPVGGWTYETALVVVGCFTLLKAVLDGAVNPSLVAVVDMIRQGTLDFVLIKPADAQFLVSTAKFQPWKAIDAALGLGILAWSFRLLGHPPRILDVGATAVLLVSATLVLYSISILVVAVSFWAVRLDNLAYLFNAIFDLRIGRYESSKALGVSCSRSSFRSRS